MQPVTLAIGMVGLVAEGYGGAPPTNFFPAILCFFSNNFFPLSLPL
jgi:hypothetical protein